MKKFFSLVLAAVMVFSLAGCSTDYSDLIGTWEQTELFEEGFDTNDAELVMPEGSLRIQFIFNADNTFTYSIMSGGLTKETLNYTYEVSGDSITLIDSNGIKLPSATYKIENGLLYYNEMVFEKVS